MPSCPVCENLQPSGEECDVCGHVFGRDPATAAPDDQVPGLEPTHFEAVAEGGARIDDLEPTAQPPVDPEPLPAVELEATRLAPVEAPETEAVEGLEPTLSDEAGLDEGTPLPTVQVCRYCRTPAPPTDAYCSRCGMHLPGLPGAARTGGRGAGDATVLCFGCGTPMRGDTCPGCGAHRG